VSFVIPVLNDANRLRRCLQSIKANPYPSESLELIVADNGSVDGSPVVAAAEGALVLTLPHCRLGELRNRAASASRGEVLAFVDADHEIADNWIQTAVDVLRSASVAAVGTACTAPRAGTPIQRVYDRLRAHPETPRDATWLGSGNMAVRRDAFDQVQGFDVTLETCEDVDLCRKLRSRGFRIVNHPGLGNVHHGDPETLRHLFLGELWRGRDNVRVSLRPPLTIRNLVSAAIPAINLAALIGLAVGLVVGGSLGLVMLFASSLSILGLIALRTIRMLRYGDSVRALIRTIQVATAYELGRALAVGAHWRYGRRRKLQELA
jgi:hypothetical protein